MAGKPSRRTEFIELFAERLMDGFGATFPFEVKGGAGRADAICAAVWVFKAAEVVEVAPAGSDLKPGDEVFGGYAEYLISDPDYPGNAPPRKLRPSPAAFPPSTGMVAPVM